MCRSRQSSMARSLPERSGSKPPTPASPPRRGLPPHPTLSPKGARAYLLFLSPLPMGEGRVRALFSFPTPHPVFPAQAGIQTFTHRRIVRGTSSSFDELRMRMIGWGVDPPPCVIARRIAPKQPRGSSIQVRFSPLGCFATLAMTRGRERGTTQPISRSACPNPAGQA